MKNKVYALILVVVLVFSTSVMISASDCVAEYNDTPRFIDEITGIEWIAIDSRICEYGMWGIDILYAPVNPDLELEPMWVCHGSLTMDNYFIVNDCYHASDSYYLDIMPTVHIPPCQRPGCNGWILPNNSYGEWARVSQRTCIHMPWGIDIQSRRSVVVSNRCNACFAGGTSITRTDYRWQCYGFISGN